MLKLVIVLLLLLNNIIVILCNKIDNDISSVSSSTTLPLSFIFNIEHSIDNGITFTNRSSLSVLRSNNFNNNNDNNKRDKEKNGIYDNDVEGFKSLLNNNGYYRIRVKSLSSYITSAIPACELQKSGFKEDIIIHMDKNDNVVSLVYSSPVAALSKQCDSLKIKSSISLLTKLRVADVINAHSIPLQAIGPKPQSLQNVNLDIIPIIDKDGKTVQPPPQQPQQSWIRRNWYLVALGGYYIWRFTQPLEAEQPKENAPAASADTKKNN